VTDWLTTLADKLADLLITLLKTPLITSLFHTLRLEHFGNLSAFWNIILIGINKVLRYHSHSELRRSDGRYGGLVIHKPLIDDVVETENYGYDEDQLLLVGD
jgi:hypothetical protein